MLIVDKVWEGQGVFWGMGMFVEVVVEASTVVDAEGWINSAEEVSVSGSIGSEEFLYSKEDVVGVYDKEGRVTKRVEFKGKVERVTFTVVNISVMVSIAMGQEAGAEEEWNGLCVFPVVGGREDVGNGDQDHCGNV